MSAVECCNRRGAGNSWCDRRAAEQDATDSEARSFRRKDAFPGKTKWLVEISHKHAGPNENQAGKYLVMWRDYPAHAKWVGTELTVANNSWAYLTGDAPRIRTDVTITQSAGCCLIVQCNTIVNGKHVDRVVLREANGTEAAYIYNRSNGAQIDGAVLGSGQYVDLDRTDSTHPVMIGGVQNIADDTNPNSPLHLLLNDVDQAATENGVTCGSGGRASAREGRK